jgi:transposase
MYSDKSQPTARGLTVADLARRYRVSPDKIRAWIGRGELAAVNTASALCGRPRWVVSPDALVEFERRRASGPPPQPRRPRKKTEMVDYFPD